ncbi:lipoprotein-releasing system transmembrane subunit LolC, partial [Methylobacterium sp. A54F]
RTELLSKIVGINGHVFVTPIDKLFTDYADLSERLSQVGGVPAAIPLVEGQAFASSPYGGSGVLVRGVRAEDLDGIAAIAKNIRGGTPAGFDDGSGVVIG